MTERHLPPQNRPDRRIHGAEITFLDCPAYLDQEGAVRCGLPAEVRRRLTLRSTDGPLESVMIGCPSGHWFNGPISSLTCDSRHQYGPADTAGAATAARGGSKASPAPLDGSGAPAVRIVPGGPEGAFPRPNGAPPYYLGRPARLWITASRPPARSSRATPIPALRG